jgi:catecholate siderophore receptor
VPEALAGPVERWSGQTCHSLARLTHPTSSLYGRGSAGATELELFMRRPLLAVVFLTLLRPLAAFAAPGIAQANSSGLSATESPRVTIQGRVLDPMRMPIAGARVTAVPDSQRSGPSTLTDQRGEFTLAVDSGRYTIRVDAPGFVDASQLIVTPQGGAESREFVLQIAGVRETVTVTVSAPGGYREAVISSATKTPTPLQDVPQSVTVVTGELMKDQLMTSIADVVRYVPGVSAHQGENNRDQIIIRGNSSSADFFVNGVRDDVQYYRDVYNLDRVEALKGPNAMIFGRGGAGGVINRVTKDADFRSLREIDFQGGMFGNKRVSVDLDEPLNGKIAFRMNGMFEHSDSFRRSVGLERHGVSPTLTIAPDSRTKITIRYEYLRDARTADRGVTSFQGRPADVDIATFYGDPDASQVKARVNVGSATVEHRFRGATLRNHTSVGGYDRSYQNFVPGAATPDMRQVSLSSYNNATMRTNLFNQTDLTYTFSTARLRHTFLAGAEVGRQLTDNFRNTGFFNNTATSILVDFTSPLTNVPVTFRQSATDADNHLRTNVAATYAQDQIELSRHLQLVAGVRFDRFDLQYLNNRNGDTLARRDNLVSPRAGLIVKPIAPLSLYTSYSVSYLPGSGDQFSSLTAVTQQVEPEKFNNYEVGAKWGPMSSLEVTTAVYRLDRTNTRSTDPNDPTRIVQTGSQRTNGYELGLNGRVTAAWNVAGGYAYQDAFVTSATTAAKTGARVGQVPHHMLSLWNSYQLHPRVRAAFGVLHRSDVFAAIDNTVMLPGYTRADAAAYLSLTGQLRLQVNIENLLDTRYYSNADSNTNISPGSPRTLRIGVTTKF